METILEYLSSNIRHEVQAFFNENQNVDRWQYENGEQRNEIEEIRIRAGKPLIIKTSKEKEILNYDVTTQDLLETFQKVCENSVYSYKKQICDGFITIKGGHRVGLTGNCVIENGQVVNVNYISSLNFRVAREKKGCSQKLLNYIIDVKNENIYNTLIASKPGAGKTTMLRDIIRNISDGIPGIMKGKTCGVVDERGEIAAMYKGVPQNDVGILTDVIDNVSKSKGMNMLIRSMSPEVIFCDEIGSKEDINAINYAICSGIKGVFTVHGDRLENLLLNDQLCSLLQKYIIERIIFLDDCNKGMAREIYKLDIQTKKYINVF